MASTTTTNNPYTFPRPSEMATRTLISGTKPTETPSTNPSTDNKPTLQKRNTNHYEEAAAAATKTGQMPATTANSAAASVTDRPATQRQPSWKMSDLRAQQQGQMIAGKGMGMGYSTTEK